MEISGVGHLLSCVDFLCRGGYPVREEGSLFLERVFLEQVVIYLWKTICKKCGFIGR